MIYFNQIKNLYNKRKHHHELLSMLLVYLHINMHFIYLNNIITQFIYLYL